MKAEQTKNKGKITKEHNKESKSDFMNLGKEGSSKRKQTQTTTAVNLILFEEYARVSMKAEYT